MISHLTNLTPPAFFKATQNLKNKAKFLFETKKLLTFLKFLSENLTLKIAFTFYSIPIAAFKP
jgi:hypothetical protein